jgi:hypothetical protein
VRGWLMPSRRLSRASDYESPRRRSTMGQRRLYLRELQRLLCGNLKQASGNEDITLR